MKKVVDNILKYTYKFVLIFTIICFSIALIGAIFAYVNRSNDYLNPLVLIPGSIVYLLLLVRLYKLGLKLSEKTQKIICIVLLALQFILLFLSTRIISSIPKVDLLHILTGINSLHNSGTIVNSNYFSVYPNNKFLLVILYGLSNISWEHSDIIYGLFSSACICTMSLFTYKTVKLVGGRQKAFLNLLICVFSPIFYLYASYTYTDVLMLPFASILIYLLVKNSREENFKKNLLYCLLIGVMAIIGYKIRAVAIFLLVAYFMYLIFQKRFKFLLKCSIPILVMGIITLGLIGKIENSIFTDTDPNKEFPFTHWVMMGVNLENEGYYAQTDYELSASAKNPKERQKLNLEVIKDRIVDQGFVGNTKLLLGKIISVWSKGDYSYQKYLTLVKDYNWSYSYLVEDENIFLNYILQCSKIAVLTLSIIALVRLLKKDEKSFIAIALFGAVLFYLVWEVCPRYGLSFLPWMILLGGYSYDYLEFDFAKYKSFKYLKYGVFFLTVVLLGVGFFKYTDSEKRSVMVAKDTDSKYRLITLEEDTTLTQSVKLNNEFNEIRLKFKVNEEEDANYKLELLNEKGKAVYEQVIESSILNDEKYTTFKLDKKYPKGNYTIKLSSDADSAVQAFVTYKEEFDYYPPGKLEVNNKEETGDLMFEVKRVEKSPIYTYAEYILIIILTLGLEYVVLFKKEGSKNEEK